MSPPKIKPGSIPVICFYLLLFLSRRRISVLRLFPFKIIRSFYEEQKLHVKYICSCFVKTHERKFYVNDK